MALAGRRWNSPIDGGERGGETDGEGIARPMAAVHICRVIHVSSARAPGQPSLKRLIITASRLVFALF